MRSLITAGTSKSTRLKRLIGVILLLILVCTLACASFRNTFIIWEGFFPAGEYHLNIRNQTGEPIPGAILHVYEEGTRTPAFEYPIDNYLKDDDLISNAQGQIIALHKNRGLEFGGSEWKLFWIIPMGLGCCPQYDCEIIAQGYKPLKFSIKRLFEAGYNDHSPMRPELKIYEAEFVLERQ